VNRTAEAYTKGDGKLLTEGGSDKKLKHTSLLHCRINYVGKKFYSTGPNLRLSNQ
jgi:hypothetical protein